MALAVVGPLPLRPQTHGSARSGALVAYDDLPLSRARTSAGSRPTSLGASRPREKAPVVWMKLTNSFNHHVAVFPLPNARGPLRRAGSEAALRRGGSRQEVRFDEGAEVTALLEAALRQQTSWPDKMGMRQVRKLNFKDFGLGEWDLRALPEVFKSIPFLDELILSSNNLGPSWAALLTAAFEHTMDLTKLALYDCGITDLAGLEKAMLKTNIVNESGCQTSFGLKVLDLGSNKISGKGMQLFPSALKEATIMHTLKMNRNPLGESGGYALSVVLSEARKLKTLNLNECSLGHRGVIGLAQGLVNCKELLELYLACNRIGGAGVEEFIEPFKYTQRLAVLDMSYNYLGQDGVQRLAFALSNNKYVQRVIICGNGLDPSAEREMAHGLRQIANGTLRPTF